MSDQEAIAKRAYELYLERGSTPGYELEDWLQAEAEVAAAAAEDSRDEDHSTPATGGRQAQAGGKRNNRRENPSGTPSRRALRP
jgi:hypothetical protein